MATITGFTAARTLEIESSTIVSGHVLGNGDLILVTRGGSEINAGNLGTPIEGSGLDLEGVQDAVGAMVVAAGGTYNDNDGSLTFPSSGTGSGLPEGIGNPDDYTAVAGAVINDCSSLTGWFASTYGPGWLTTYQGKTAVIQKVITNEGGWAALDTGSLFAVQAPYVLFEFAWEGVDGQNWPISWTESLFLSDGSHITGNKVYSPIPSIPSGQWTTLVVPVQGMTQIRSLGTINNLGGYASSGQAINNYFHSIRWANQTEADQALAEGAVFISPTYTPGITPDVIGPVDGKTRVDLRPDRVWTDRFGGYRHVREWEVPEDGLSDAGDAIGRALSALEPGQTLLFPPGGYFWVDEPIGVPSYTTIDFNGSSVFTRVWRGGDNNSQDPILGIGGRNVHVKNFKFFGYREDVRNGALLTSDGTGSPTVSGDNMLLDSQGESITRRTVNNGTPWYARYPLVMFPETYRTMIKTAYPTFVFGNAWVFTLSDSTHVSGDCVIEAVNDQTGAVEETRTLTLTGTPTEYVLAWQPNDVEKKVAVRIRKATATENTITVTSVRSFGFTEYSGSHDSANIISVNGAQNVLIEDFLIEGAATDAVDVTNAANRDIIVRNGMSRACSRQGLSFNNGVGVTFENIHIIGPHRSGVDIEPYALDWLADRVTLRDLRIIGCENYALAMANWAGITNLVIDGIVSERCGVGFMTGGGRNGTITNIVTDGSISVSGVNLRGSNITCSRFSLGGGVRNYAPTNSMLAESSAVGSGNTFSVYDTSKLAVGMRVLVNGISGESIRRITEISGLNVTLDGDSMTWTVITLWPSSSRYVSAYNVFSDIAINGSGTPEVHGKNNHVTDVRGTADPKTISGAVFAFGGMTAGGHTQNVVDSFTNKFTYSFLAPRSTETPFIYGRALNFHGQSFSGVNGISGNKVTGSLQVTDATRGRATTSSLDLGMGNTDVMLYFDATAWAGLDSQLNLEIQASADNTNWYTVGWFEDINVLNRYEKMPIRWCERYIRASYYLTGTDGGTSVSFTLTAVYNIPTRNLSGTWTGSSSSSATVAFPSKGGPRFSGFSLTMNGGGGTMTPATYYYRVGARTRQYGPSYWHPEVSEALSAGQLAMNINIYEWLNGPHFAEGFTVLRGTSAGTYTTRYDVLPKANVELPSMRTDNTGWVDRGGYLESNGYFTEHFNTYPTANPKLTATDESGFELDNGYRVFTMPAYSAITKRVDGFDVTFPSALTAFDWFIVR